MKYLDNKEKNNIKLSDEPAAKKIINKTKILIGTFLCILIFSGIYFAFQTLKKGKTEKSIAVLPFKSLSSDPEKQYKADGMMDAITLHLSKIINLRVLGRTTTEQYRNQNKTPVKIGHELQVSYLLEGSYQG